MPCLLVTTSGRNRRYVVPEVDWLTADLEALVAVLDDDVDVLLNPGARMTRLTGDFVRDALGLDDAEATALLLRSGPQRRQLIVVAWTVD